MSYEISHPKKRALLAAYVRVASITKAAEIAGVTRETHYNWKDDDPEYAAAFEASKQIACEALEDEATRRAFEGSDTLLIFLLKGNRPDKYRDQWKGELSGPNGGPIKSEVEVKLSAEEAYKRMLNGASE